LEQSAPPIAGFGHEFEDPDAFSTALMGGSFEYLPLPGHAFRARLDVLVLGDLVLQVGDQGAHTARGAIHDGLSILILTLPTRQARVRMNGQPTSPSLGYLSPGGREFHAHSEAEVSWGALAVPEAMLAQAAEMAPESIRLARMAGVLNLPEAPQRRLAGAVAAAAQMATQQPEALFQPGCAEGLVRSMQELLAETLNADSRLLPVTRATREAYRVVRDAEAFLEANLGRPIFRNQLCEALGVSLRKLHDCFMATTGMSPLAYLKTRRLMLARRALRRAEGGQGLVKAIALAHGFWHFGHFAQDYRAQFGESPSETRARPRETEPGIAWLRGVPP
jgi:AraC family transcriptional regulator, ethanolamine operon transcriptional activator